MNTDRPKPFTKLPTEAQRLNGRNRALNKKLRRDGYIQRRATAEGAVLKWLLNHPESTCDEIFKGCGFPASSAHPRFIDRSHNEEGKITYTVNMLKYRRYLKTGERPKYHR